MKKVLQWTKTDLRIHLTTCHQVNSTLKKVLQWTKTCLRIRLTTCHQVISTLKKVCPLSQSVIFSSQPRSPVFSERASLFSRLLIQ